MAGKLAGISYGFIGAMPRIRIVVAAAAMLAGAITLAGGETAPARSAGLKADVTVASFSERWFDAGAMASDCSARSWPYLGADCLRMPDGSRTRPVRVIAIDRQSGR